MNHKKTPTEIYHATGVALVIGFRGEKTHFNMKKASFLIAIFCLLLSTSIVFANIALSPSSVNYQLANNTDDYAEGTISVTVPNNLITNNEIIIYWGNNNTILEDYSYLTKRKIQAQTTAISISAGIIIPPKAEQLLTFIRRIGDTATTNTPYILKLPKDAAAKSFGTPLAEFQVVSDIHITKDKKKVYANNSKHYQNMLRHVAKTSGEKSLGIIINGDITQKGIASEYQLMKSLTDEIPGVPNIYLSIGNHDIWGVWKKRMTMKQSDDLFLSFTQLPDGTKPTDTSYDFWLGGYHFIILGTDIFNTLNATFTKSTLDWIDKKLSENYDKERPTFVFVHQSIRNTVGGSYPEHTDFDKLNRTGVINWKELKAILGKYESTFVFTSHSHWSMYSGTSYFTEEGQPNYFNTAAISYICDDYNKVTGERMLNESQGYYVYIYKDKTLVRGYDFINNVWISPAQFRID